MADSNGNWTLIESDPGVFTELISNFGAKGLEVEELWTITDQTKNEEVFGVIFLFKWEPSAQFVRDVIEWDQVPNVFFAKQVIQNACATQAILSVLMNCPPSVDIGEELQKFKEFTMQLDPGLSISNSDLIRNSHNQFSRADPFFMDEKVRDEDAEDNFHFIAYVPIDGCIYELDGLLGGPVQVGKFDVSESKSWVRNLLPVLEHRMNSYYGREIRFSILSVIRSKLDRLEEQLKKVNEQAQNGTLSMEVAENERNLLLSKIIEQKEKHQRYKKENACRRHNFVPLIFEILKQMSSEGCLHTAVKSAQQKKQDRLEGKGWFPY